MGKEKAMKKSVEGTFEADVLEQSMIETDDDVLTFYDMFNEFDGKAVRVTMEEIK